MDDADVAAWREEIGPLRLAARQQVPDLIDRRRLPPVDRIVRTATTLGSAVVAWALLERRHRGPTSRSGLSRRLRRAFERLGPSYIKLGQVISSGEGILPEELVHELRFLRDQVAAEPFDVVQHLIEAELGRPLAEVFESFDEHATAAASIAQVHMAVLRTGEAVAVKVRRPDIQRLVAGDLAVMSWIAPLLTRRIDLLRLVNLPAVIELFAETIVEELDFRLEADNMLAISDVLARSGQTSIVVPRPHLGLVTPGLLVMERMAGFAFDDVAGMRSAAVDTRAVLHALLVSVLEGAMIHGVFHGDLHGGNLLVQRDGRVALLDYGITGRLDHRRRVVLLQMMLASMSGDHRRVLQGYQQLGAIAPDADLDAFMAEIPVDRPLVDPAAPDADQMVTEMRQVTKALLRYGTKLPKELMLFMKDFLFIDTAIATLEPDLDVMGEMVQISQYFIRRHGAQITAEVGMDPADLEIDPEEWAAQFGIDPDHNGVSHRAIRRQRREMREKLSARRRRS